jgi:hypothetical protein
MLPWLNNSFTAQYSVSAIIGKPHRVPLVKSSGLTIHSRPQYGLLHLLHREDECSTQ